MSHGDHEDLVRLLVTQADGLQSSSTSTTTYGVKAGCRTDVDSTIGRIGRRYSDVSYVNSLNSRIAMERRMGRESPHEIQGWTDSGWMEEG